MIYTPLMPHQIEALDYLKRHDPCALFMDLGSGKSLVALAYAEHVKAKRILITADKNNVLNTWPEEIAKHTNYDVIERPDKKRLNDIPVNPDTPLCVLANYELLAARKWDWHKNWDMWIGDESAEFKDQRTDKHKSIRFISTAIPHRIILNGKAATERLEDIYGQLALVGRKHSRFPSTFTQFKHKYMLQDSRGYGWVPKRSAYTNLQRDMKDISYWWKNDGSVTMPRCCYHKIEIELTDEQRRIDRELKTEFESCFEGEKIETNYAAVCYIKRIQLAGGVFRAETEWHEVPSEKPDVLVRLIKENPDSKIAVWHTYIPETELITRHLMEHGITFSVVDSPECSEELNLFERDEKVQVLVIRTSLCKGLNKLVGSDLAVFYSHPLSFYRYSQAVGRINRLNSRFEDTHVVDLVVTDSADEAVYQMLSQKRSFSTTFSNLRKLI